MKRKYSNMQIVRKLHQYFNENPDIRFIQGLWDLGLIDYEDYEKFIIKDRHYEESGITLKRMKTSIKHPGRKETKCELVSRKFKEAREIINLALSVVVIEVIADYIDLDDDGKERNNK